MRLYTNDFNEADNSFQHFSIIAKLWRMNTAIVYQEMGGTEHRFELQMFKVKYNSIQFN